MNSQKKLTKQFSDLLNSYPSDEIMLLWKAFNELNEHTLDKLCWRAYQKQVPDAKVPEFE